MVYFGTLICPFSTKSLLRLHGFLLTLLFFQSLKWTNLLSMIHVFLLLKILKLQKRHALKTLAAFSKRLQVQSVESCFISRSESQHSLSSTYLHQISMVWHSFWRSIFWKCNCIWMLFHKEFQLIVILWLLLASCNNVGGYFPIWRAASRLLKTDATHIFQFDKIFFFSLHAILGNMYYIRIGH